MFGFKKKNIMLGCMTALMVVCVNSSSVFAEYNYSEYPYDSISGKYSARLTDYCKGDLSKYTKNKIANRHVLQATNRILQIQKKIAQANGLVVEKRQGGFDFKQKVTPAVLVEGYNNACMTVAGDMLLGIEHLKKDGYDVYTYNNNNFIAESELFATIAHETGHSVLNHALNPTNEQEDRTPLEEGDADLFAVRTAEKLSEYGWHTGLLARTEDNCESMHNVVTDYIKNNSKGKLIVNPYDQNIHSVSKLFKLNVNGKYISSSDFGTAFVNKLGYYYSQKHHQMFDFALGQLGYIYGKDGKLDVKNLRLEANTENEYGKTRLVYRSPNMPNGYKNVAYFQTDLNTMKNNIQNAENTIKSVNKGNPSAESMDFALCYLIYFTMNCF